MYLLPGILGCVDGHGNDRVSKRINKLMTAFAKANVHPDVAKTAAKHKAVVSGGKEAKANEKIKEEAKEERRRAPGKLKSTSRTCGRFEILYGKP